MTAILEVGSKELDVKVNRILFLIIGNWRFATLEQLQKSGIFTVSRKWAYNRLLQLCRDGYLQATILGRGQMCYRLTAKGGEVAGYADPYWSRRCQDAGRDVVLKALTALLALLTKSRRRRPPNTPLRECKNGGPIICKANRLISRLCKSRHLLHSANWR